MSACIWTYTDRNARMLLAVNEQWQGTVHEVSDSVTRLPVPWSVPAATHVCISPGRPIVYLFRPEERMAFALDCSTATVRWRCTIPGEIDTAQLADDRVMLVLTSQGRWMAIDSECGAISSEGPGASTLAADSRLSNVVVRMRSAAERLQWLDAVDGLRLRATVLGNDCRCRRIFRSAFTERGVAVVESGSRLVELVDYDTGALRWRAEVPQSTFVQGMMASLDRSSVIAIARSIDDGWVADCIWFDARDGSEQARRAIPRECWAIEAACHGECFVGRNGFLEVATMRHIRRSYE